MTKHNNKIIMKRNDKTFCFYKQPQQIDVNVWVGNKGYVFVISWTKGSQKKREKTEQNSCVEDNKSVC